VLAFLARARFERERERGIMATQEYLLKHIEASSTYDALPERLKILVSEEQWNKRVKEYCIHRGLPWDTSAARTVCVERIYYDDLLQEFRTLNRVRAYLVGVVVDDLGQW
jgi:hypothetical protein